MEDVPDIGQISPENREVLRRNIFGLQDYAETLEWTLEKYNDYAERQNAE
jgi:hypothetical protein